MRAVVQRVSSASVTIAGEVRASIEHGLLVLVGVEKGDGVEDIEWLGRHPDEARLVAEAKKGASEHPVPHGSSHGAEPKKAAADHGSPHGGAEAKKAGATDHDAPHGEGPEATAEANEHGKVPPPAPPPNLPVAFAIVTLAATIGGAISSRLIRS